MSWEPTLFLQMSQRVARCLFAVGSMTSLLVTTEAHSLIVKTWPFGLRAICHRVAYIKVPSIFGLVRP